MYHVGKPICDVFARLIVCRWWLPQLGPLRRVRPRKTRAGESKR